MNRVQQWRPPRSAKVYRVDVRSSGGELTDSGDIARSRRRIERRHVSGVGRACGGQQDHGGGGRTAQHQVSPWQHHGNFNSDSLGL
jgi:hypothetical protein